MCKYRSDETESIRTRERAQAIPPGVCTVRECCQYVQLKNQLKDNRNRKIILFLTRNKILYSLLATVSFQGIGQIMCTRHGPTLPRGGKANPARHYLFNEPDGHKCSVRKPDMTVCLKLAMSDKLKRSILPVLERVLCKKNQSLYGGEGGCIETTAVFPWGCGCWLYTIVFNR